MRQQLIFDTFLCVCCVDVKKLFVQVGHCKLRGIMATNVTMFGSEDVYLDKFQQTLLEMTSSASAAALSKFFQKNYRPLYQFLLRLYLSSLTVQHPDRGLFIYKSVH